MFNTKLELADLADDRDNLFVLASLQRAVVDVCCARGFPLILATSCNVSLDLRNELTNSETI